jgi:hypothetical protein
MKIVKVSVLTFARRADPLVSSMIQRGCRSPRAETASGKRSLCKMLHTFCIRAVHALSHFVGQAELVQKLSRSFCIRAVHALSHFVGQAELVQKLSRSFCRTVGSNQFSLRQT